MYLRPAFVETDLDRIEGLIRAHPFGVLVTRGADGMEASHIPFAVERNGGDLVLIGHLATPNAQCAQFDGGEALAIFSGPHAYISPSWYKTQPSVPTWDFSAVHIHGTLQPVMDHMAMLDQLAAEDPGVFNAIRSFRLPAARIEAQWKMSQNRSIDDRKGVIAGLRAQGFEDVAREVEATLP
jgi:transcriptional regulator